MVSPAEKSAAFVAVRASQAHYQYLIHRPLTGEPASQRLSSRPQNDCSYRRPCRSALVTEQPGLIALPIALFGAIAFVVKLASAANAEFDFRPAAVVEIELKRHQRVALALDQAGQSGDLAAVKQQFSRP